MPNDADIVSISVPRVLLSGTHVGAGVSTILFGLVVSYIRQQVGIGAAALGTSLIEPTHYRRLSNRLCYTIAPTLLDESMILSSIRRLSDGTELAVFEGSGGLYDSLPEGSAYSSLADFAASTKTPVVLVIDGRGFGESVAALIQGFTNFRKDVHLAGVILNRLSNKDALPKIKKSIESISGVKFLGAVRQGDPHQMGATLASYRAHNPSALTRNRVIGTGNLIKEGIDLDAFQQVAKLAAPLTKPIQTIDFKTRRARIAVADDQAFHLTIQDNLDLLRRAGAELVPFSPIADQHLPKNCHGVYFPGGYPQLYAPDLQANVSIRKAIREYIEAGGAFYAEAGALSYLSRRLTTFQGIAYEMVGALPWQASAVYADDIQPELPRDNLEGKAENVLSKGAWSIRGLREIRWTYRFDSTPPIALERLDRDPSSSTQGTSVPEAFCPRPNLFVSRCYLHWASRPEVAKQFVEQALLGLRP